MTRFRWIAVCLLVGCGSEVSVPSADDAAAVEDGAVVHDDAHDMDEGTADDAGATSDTDTTTPNADGIPTVHVGSYYYRPAALTVPVGTKVRFVFDGGTHTVTSGTSCTSDGKFNSGRKTSGTWEYTFTTAGTFPYFCDYMTHCTARNQVGTITVTP